MNKDKIEELESVIEGYIGLDPNGKFSIVMDGVADRIKGLLADLLNLDKEYFTQVSKGKTASFSEFFEIVYQNQQMSIHGVWVTLNVNSVNFGMWSNWVGRIVTDDPHEINKYLPDDGRNTFIFDVNSWRTLTWMKEMIDMINSRLD